MADEFNQNVNNDAQVQLAVDAAMKEQKKKKRKKKIIILAVVLVVIIIIGVIAASGDSDSKTVEAISTSAAAADSGEDGAPSTEAESAAVQGDDKIGVGNVITTGDLKISYLSCDADFKDYDTYWTPSSGNKVIRAEFKFENISSGDVSLGSFDCYADGKKCEEFYGPGDLASPTLETVSSGRTFDAVIYFEVPENAKEIELELADDFWSNQKTIFIVE